jgi:hypothetical protein
VFVLASTIDLIETSQVRRCELSWWRCDRFPSL